MPTTTIAPTVPTVDELKELLKTNPRARERALLVLLDRQTADEQATQTTREHNGQGFTAYDAELLTSFAQQVQRNRYGNPNGQRLSVRQHEIAAKRLPKYAKQLRLVAAVKAETVSEENRRYGASIADERAMQRMEVEGDRQERVRAAASDARVNTLFSECPECQGHLTVDRNVGGECEEVPCPRCCGPIDRR
jgi:hypothetical protein